MGGKMSEMLGMEMGEVMRVMSMCVLPPMSW